jgi:hypothetical protein
MMRRQSQVLPHAGIDPSTLLICVAEHGWVVLTDMPCREGNRPLLDLAAGIGTVNAAGASDEAHEGGGVFRVTPFPHRVLDVTGKPLLSVTATDFALHTDQSYAPAPSRYVFLHCWREGAQGGDSLLARSEAVSARLEPWALELCFRVQFQWRDYFAPILTRLSGLDWPMVRFNAREIAGDAIDEDEPDLRARLVPEIFLAAANAAADRILLEPGDCLVLDNRRVLHGRTAFDSGSKRLLKQVWVNVPDEGSGPAAAPHGAMYARNRSTAASGR